MNTDVPSLFELLTSPLLTSVEPGHGCGAVLSARGGGDALERAAAI